MSKKGIEVNVCWGKNMIQSEWQKKVFKDEPSALAFLSNHYETIQWINHCKTLGNKVSKIDMIRAINNPDDYFGENVVDSELMRQWR